MHLCLSLLLFFIATLSFLILLLQGYGTRDFEYACRTNFNKIWRVWLYHRRTPPDTAVSIIRTSFAYSNIAREALKIFDEVIEDKNPTRVSAAGVTSAWTERLASVFYFTFTVATDAVF